MTPAAWIFLACLAIACIALIFVVRRFAKLEDLFATKEADHAVKEAEGATARWVERLSDETDEQASERLDANFGPNRKDKP